MGLAKKVVDIPPGTGGFSTNLGGMFQHGIRASRWP
jgi:hypothetical protein